MPRFLILALSLVLVPARLPAQEIPRSEYAGRRDSLLARVDSGVVIAFGAPDAVGIRRWNQHPAFRYLTGFLEPNAVLALVKRGGTNSGILFTASRDPRRALYDGFPPDSAAVARETGFTVRSLPALRPTVDSLIALGLPVHDIRDFATADAATQDTLTRGGRFIADIVAGKPGLTVRNLHPTLDSLRRRKSPAELALLRRAINVTVDAHKEALRTTRPGMWEYQLEALVESVFRRSGCDGPSFTSIIGSGPNSTQYHYNTNNRQMRAGEVVVMDIGAACGGYAADVTRTIPISGRFTREQRAIYQLVRDAQAASERVAKPGASWQAWRGLAQAGGGRGLGPGQGIGLEVHDPPHPWFGTGSFQVGDAFTIEPGIYISTRLLDMLPDTPKNRAMIAKVRPVVERYQNIGVRIEDDYVITPKGIEWLSRAPRDLEEDEKLRSVSQR